MTTEENNPERLLFETLGEQLGDTLGESPVERDKYFQGLLGGTVVRAAGDPAWPVNLLHPDGREITVEAAAQTITVGVPLDEAGWAQEQARLMADPEHRMEHYGTRQVYRPKYLDPMLRVSHPVEMREMRYDPATGQTQRIDHGPVGLDGLMELDFSTLAPAKPRVNLPTQFWKLI